MRNCLYEPIAELFEAAMLLQKAAVAHVAGDRPAAEALLAQADLPAIFQWSEALFAGKTIAAEIKARIFCYSPDPDRPVTVAENDRAGKTIPTALARQVIQRDGYFCRYCGIPVIDPKAQSHLRKAYPHGLRWGGRNIDKHTAFQALDLDLDHLVPRSRGGRNTLENLIVTCAPCNCGKAHRTLREMGLNDPRERAPVVPNGFEIWDGLTLVLRKPAHAPAAGLNPSQRSEALGQSAA